MIRFLPKLTALRPGKPEGKERKVIVFVHGIFSSHATFAELIDSFENDEHFDSYDLYGYDYDWGEPILTSARRLRSILDQRVPEGAEITLVAHSMGGLVSRFALVAGHLRGVKRIFMLGTPNFGALTARQLSLLWQVAVASAGKITPIFPRKAGLRDLTRPQTLYESIPDSRETRAARALDVEYVTIPGLFYGDERRDTDPGPQNEALPFVGGKLVLETLANWRLLEVKIDRPHDGIVEEQSVNLETSVTGRISEKSVTIEKAPRFGCTYCHVAPVTMRDRAHMGIQRDAKTAATIKGIMAAGSILAWEKGLGFAERNDYSPIRIPGV